MVSSTAPRFEARWPPVPETDFTRNVRSSAASFGNSTGASARRSAGLWRVSSREMVMSERPLDNEVGQLPQPIGRRAQRVEGSQCVGAQFQRQFACARCAEQADVGGLVAGGILAGGLAEGGGGGFGVEHIVDDLECEPDALGVAIERSGGGVGDLAAVRAEQYRGANQGAGLVDVHELELGQVERLADAGKIDRLAARHAARAGRLR